MQKLFSILTLGFMLFTAIVPNALSADTLDDIGKAIGVWQRFMQDLQKTQSQATQPDCQPTPTIRQGAITPPPSSDEPAEPEVTE